MKQLLKKGEMEKNTLEFECMGIKDGGKFPVENTGRGKDISPEFIIKNLSPHAQTFMITLEDLSHPIKRFTHWVIWNIPATDKIAKARRYARDKGYTEGQVQESGQFAEFLVRKLVSEVLDGTMQS